MHGKSRARFNFFGYEACVSCSIAHAAGSRSEKCNNIAFHPFCLGCQEGCDGSQPSQRKCFVLRMFFSSQQLCRLTHALMLSQSRLCCNCSRTSTKLSEHPRDISCTLYPNKTTRKSIEDAYKSSTKKTRKKFRRLRGAVSRSRNHSTSISLCLCLSYREGKNKLVNLPF